jgi:hypothetical protein
MNRTRWRFFVACLAVIGAAVAVGGGSAGNRTADVTFQYLPGTSFTYGQEFATKTTITNTGASMFTQLEVHQLVPTSAGTPLALKGSSCGAVIEGAEAVCRFDQLSAGNTITVTLLWQTPASGSGCAACVTTDGYWVIKEGKPTNANEAFPFEDGTGIGPFPASLLGDDPSSERKRAGGYETTGVGLEVAACDVGTGNLHTNPALTKDDPVSSTLCLPEFTIPAGSSALGYSSTITETSAKPSIGSHTELGQSIVCVAALGQACTTEHTPADWGTARARQIFQILEDALRGKKEIDAVYHNGTKLPLCSVNAMFAEGCVVEIRPPAKGSDPAIWVVIADAPTNGPWNW